jgi:hypothetical protein
MERRDLLAVCCADCGHIVTVRPDKREQELKKLGWENKGEGWQCPHCYYNEKCSKEGREE